MKNSATYKLAIAKSRGSHFAIVTLESNPASESGAVAVAPSAFDWLRESYGPDAFIWPTDCDYALGAIRGVEYALANTTRRGPEVGILITEIQSHDCHGNEESAAVAAAHATWDLLEDPGKDHPIINADLEVIWPGSTPPKPVAERADPADHTSHGH